MKIMPSVIASIVLLNEPKGSEGSKGGAKNIILFPTSAGGKEMIFPGGSLDDFVIDFPM